MRRVLFVLFLALVIVVAGWNVATASALPIVIEQLSDSEILNAGVLIIAVLVLILTFRPGISLRDFHAAERVLYGFSALSLVFAGTLIYFIFTSDFQAERTIKLSAFAIVGSAVIGLFGWFVGHLISVKNHRGQHTLNLLLQMRQSEVMNKHRRAMYSKYPPHVLIPADDVTTLFDERRNHTYENETGPLVDSILYIMNFYEFIATGIRRGNIDLIMVEKTHKTILLRFFHKVFHIIAFLVYSPDAPYQKQSLYENLLWLIRQWEPQSVSKLNEAAKQVRTLRKHAPQKRSI